MAEMSDDLKVTRLINMGRRGVRIIEVLRTIGASSEIIKAVQAALNVKDSLDLPAEALRKAAGGYGLLAEARPDLL